MATASEYSLERNFPDEKSVKLSPFLSGKIEALGSDFTGQSSQGFKVITYDNQTYFVKLVKSHYETLFHNEVNIMLKLQAKKIPNIPRLHDYYFSPQGSLLIFDFKEGGDLWANSLEPVSRQFLLQLFYEIGFTLKEMHAMEIAHRDVKLENIIYSNGHFYLIDFGLSGNNLTSKVGTACGLPESVRRAYEMDLPVTMRMLYNADMFALGVVAFQLLELKVPFLWKDDNEDVYDYNRPIKMITQDLVLKSLIQDLISCRVTAEDLYAIVAPCFE